jgi:hypothetical protein
VAESVGDPVPPAESEGTRYTTDPSAFDPSATSGERKNESVHKSQGVNPPERMPTADKNDLKKHDPGSAFDLAFWRYSCVLLFLIRFLV